MAAVERAQFPAGPQALAELLACGVRDVLGADLIGIYLYGSHVSGGFDVGVSDVDLVVITAREVEDLDLAGLDRVHRETTSRHPEWRGRVEVVYIGRATLDSFRTSTGSLAVISPGEDFHLTGPLSDWAQNWYLLRLTGVALFGPPPGDVVPAVTHSEFITSVVRYARHLRATALDEQAGGSLAYALLSVCRALRTVRSGRPCSKQEGAIWVSRLEPESAWLIEEALACRLRRGRGCFETAGARDAAVGLIRALADEVMAHDDH